MKFAEVVMYFDWDMELVCIYAGGLDGAAQGAADDAVQIQRSQ